MEVTNPDKPFFPARGLTKGDLVAYYIGVADLALPHLRRRPFHMKRFTDGVEGEFFHQKRVPAKHPDFVDEVFVQFPSGHSTVFAIVDDEALWFKADKVSDAQWDRAGAARFTYSMGEGRTGGMNYRRAPDGVYDDVDELRRWAGLAVEAGVRGPKKRKGT